MTLQGTVAELSINGSITSFLLHVPGSPDVRVQTSTPLLIAIVNGDRVEVRGQMPPDPPFLADIVIKLLPPPRPTPIRFPWKWVIAGCVACLLVLIAMFVLRDKGATWTLQVRDINSAQPAAGILVQLFDQNKVQLQTATTDAKGECVFSKLRKGSYTASGAGGVTTSFVSDGKVSRTSTMSVHSPYMWTVRTVSCARPAANIAVSLANQSNATLQNIHTDAKGEFTFANLKSGSYRAVGPFGRVVTAVVDGNSAPAIAVINAQPPNIFCFMPLVPK